jgi:hypothetical protein
MRFQPRSIADALYSRERDRSFPKVTHRVEPAARVKICSVGRTFIALDGALEWCQLYS